MLCALGEMAYILLVALIMQNASQIFQNDQKVVGSIAFLLLFVFSASFSGAVILGKPALLYLEGKKKEAVILFGATLGWMFIFIAILVILSALRVF